MLEDKVPNRTAADEWNGGYFRTARKPPAGRKKDKEGKEERVKKQG